MDIQVLEVAAGERNVSNDLDLAIAGLGDDDLVTEVADAALDLDAVVQELLESGDVEDLVAGRLGGVDGELCSRQAGAHTFGGVGLGVWPTFLVTFGALRPPRAYPSQRLAYCSILASPDGGRRGNSKAVQIRSVENIQGREPL